jgi:hypothetical protein
MYAPGIPGSSNLLDYNPHSVRNSRMQQFRQEFQQLGQDLQSGNLATAQTDFTALQQVAPQPNANSSALGKNPIAGEFQQLSQGLQSGNLSTAQQDFTSILQVFKGLTSLFHHHPHHAGAAAGTTGTGETSPATGIGQLLGQLGQALQSGSLSASQQAYTALQQDLPQFQAGGMALPRATAGSGGISVSA